MDFLVMFLSGCTELVKFLSSIFREKEDEIFEVGQTSIRSLPLESSHWIRPLGYVERFMTRSERWGNMSTVYAVWLEAVEEIDFKAINTTIHLMVKKMPHLRLCLGSHKNDIWWRMRNSDSLDVSEIHSNKDVTTIVEDLLKKPYNTQKGPLWFVRFLKSIQKIPPNSSSPVKQSQVCFFGFHHNFSDGTTNMKFCDIFLTLLNDHLQNKTLDLSEVGSFAYPIQDDLANSDIDYYFTFNLFFLRLYNIIFAYGKCVRNFSANYPLPSDQEGKTLILTNEMSEFETASLLQRCKMEGVTLNTAFTAAANLGMHKLILHRDETITETRFDSQQTINMRRYWPKDKQKDSFGCHIFATGIQVPTSEKDSDEFWEYARKVHRIMYRELNVTKNSIKTHPISESIWIAIFVNTLIAKLKLPSVNDCHYCITNMGNISTTFPGDGDKVSVSKILRSVSCHHMPSLCQHTLQTFKGKFYYSFDYYPHKMTVDTARLYSNTVMNTLRTATYIPN